MVKKNWKMHNSIKKEKEIAMILTLDPLSFMY